jgi:hypothetical protein
LKTLPKMETSEELATQISESLKKKT